MSETGMPDGTAADRPTPDAEVASAPDGARAGDAAEPATHARPAVIPDLPTLGALARQAIANGWSPDEVAAVMRVAAGPPIRNVVAPPAPKGVVQPASQAVRQAFTRPPGVAERNDPDRT